MTRWDEMIGNLVGVLPPAPATVVVDGADAHNAAVTDRLTAAVGPRVTAGPHWRATRPDVLVWLRVGRRSADSAEQQADVVIDLHDPEWPVIRHVDARLADRTRWYLPESRAFFAVRAATWDTRFGDDLPAYAAAVAEAGLPTGGTAVDVGCGTGRALPALRAAVGPTGHVLGVDLTPEMLAVAAERSGPGRAALVLGDARRLPLRAATADAVFAAGLVAHLPDPTEGLRELARITRPGGRLVIFHPSGRVALATRHGRTVRPDEPLSEGPLTAGTAAAGWRLDRYDDAPHRFLALATRV
ncbi:methyltransferase domain-containing protein [Asanoa sp. WMMD1127]|uniref:methyltransferase domain-containing protein n=1 Tax=Asanoa sp. WMMD1127 TaxID=3016107 RepID=UPI002416E5DA|nr:methyltransferase domain-containing protein [Asanoa sp. WMMD1127]MDG4823183.1 methyltransferase domain-containing protein [Asanoa sp. WMMD1127]